ncbi:hypothetical protein N7454_008994 [Penicillium verhagenii]|nr:hypothetical protein N7454_008994 [Penicillium verhagenii]
MILTHFQYFPQSETEPELPSDEYIKTGFVKAFEHLKDVSRENTEIEIASVHIVLVPDFFDFRIRMLVNDAAEAARVNPNGVMIISPQDMIKAYPGCLDDEITKMPILDPVRTEETVMIVDYGMTYLHLHTQSKRCRMKIALDSYSCSRVAILLFYRVLSLGGPLSRQIEQGASKPQLFEALWRAKFAMEQTTETPWDVDSQDHYEEWPLDLQNWWIDEEEDAVLRWEDVQAIEDEYIDELAEYLDQALDCLQGERKSRSVLFSRMREEEKRTIEMLTTLA